MSYLSCEENGFFLNYLLETFWFSVNGSLQIIPITGYFQQTISWSNKQSADLSCYVTVAGTCVTAHNTHSIGVRSWPNTLTEVRVIKQKAIAAKPLLWGRGSRGRVWCRPRVVQTVLTHCSNTLYMREFFTRLLIKQNVFT